MKKNLNAHSKQIAGTTGAYSTKVESFNLDGEDTRIIVLHTHHTSSIGPATWFRIDVVYLVDKQQLAIMKREVHVDCNKDCRYEKIVAFDPIATGELTFF